MAKRSQKKEEITSEEHAKLVKKENEESKEKANEPKEVDNIEENNEKKDINYPKLKKLKVLVYLIIIIVVLDALVLLYFLKPNFDFFEKSNNITEKVTTNGLACKDGTPNEKCSIEKPYYCYKGELLKKAFTCGCPIGYKADFQDCKKI